ncbi:unnamed protein product [Blumeria hordei]|uniref:Uncharacterized protein n=1 Tax=Blumeria hordei TaxID=2867405 RepID=A0A383UM34_BLUHO|nr:unnamed protein product [Blumeria hordei]
MDMTDSKCYPIDFQRRKGLPTEKTLHPTTSAPSKIVSKAKRYAHFFADHVKRGEMPWTHWYCCKSVNGAECEKENHRLHKQCKTCKHRVCENCIKGTL